eukprot:ANDGO_08110.mRNA.1 Dual specificity mitogen-activated protein kinase kinase 1
MQVLVVDGQRRMVKHTPLAAMEISGANVEQIVADIRQAYSNDSPYLLQLLDLRHDGSQLTTITEFMDMGSLQRVVEAYGRPLPESVVAAIAFQLLHGLDFLMARKTIHRSITPSHILLSSEGDVKLAGFESSRRLDRTGDNAATMVGSVSQYIAPERLRGDARHSVISDMFSFGMCILFAARGSDYINASLPMSQIFMRLQEPIQVSNALPQSTNELKTFVEDAVAPENERRTAQELLQSDFIQLNAPDEFTAKFVLSDWMRSAGIPPALWHDQ